MIRMVSTILRLDAGTFAVGGVTSTSPQAMRLRIGALPLPDDNHDGPVAMNGGIDLPIEHARALGEYLIAVADRVEESDRRGMRPLG